MSYVTIVAGFNTSGENAKLLLSTAWLFKIATHRLFNIVKQMPVLPASDIGWKSMFYKIVYGVIPNRRYSYGVITLVRSIYESCRQLGVDFKSVELSEWLMFQQSEKECPPRSITLKTPGEVEVTVFNYNKESRRIVLGVNTSEAYKKLLEAILREKQPYMPRIYVKSWNTRSGELYIKGELQVAVPANFYYKHMTRARANSGKLYGGVDVNVDRINLVIIDGDGRLRDTYTFWFEEASRKGCSRHRARSIICMKVHEMLEHAYSHGVKVLFLENPGVLGKLKLLWIRSDDRRHKNYNYKVSVFRSSVIEMIALKAPLYGIEVKYVDPKGTTSSREHDDVMRKYRLDRHTASAYLIALKGLKQP
jgi:IS605 OrfB family transposase